MGGGEVDLILGMRLLQIKTKDVRLVVRLRYSQIGGGPDIGSHRQENQ